VEDSSFKILPSTLEAIRFVVTSDAWEQFFVPALINMKEDWARKLMDPGQARKDEHPDDYIRGCFATIDVFLGLPKALVEEYDAHNEREAQAQVEADTWERRARTGRVGPYTDEADRLREGMNNV